MNRLEITMALLERGLVRNGGFHLRLADSYGTGPTSFPCAACDAPAIDVCLWVEADSCIAPLCETCVHELGVDGPPKAVKP